MARLILMLGPSLDHPGGMTEVVRTYRAGGAFDAWPLRYVATYAGRGLLTRLQMWLWALGTQLGLLMQRRVALVHVHSAAYGSFWRKSMLCALACAFRVPYVLHLHDGRFTRFYRQKGFVFRFLIRTVLRKAARVVVLSRHWRDEVGRIEPAARTAIVANPVAVPAALPGLRRAARTVLFLNWLHEEKGVLDLVRAMPAVLRALPQARLVLAGSGDSGALLELARSLRVAQSLHLPGWIGGSEKDALLREAGVLVLPSYYEGMPMGLLEAMARGVPVIASAVGGIPDLIEHRVNGLLVEPGQPEALARAIIAVLGDAALGSRLREAAHREAGERYSTASVLHALELLYRELGIAHASKEIKPCAAS